MESLKDMEIEQDKVAASSETEPVKESTETSEKSEVEISEKEAISVSDSPKAPEIRKLEVGSEAFSSDLMALGHEEEVVKKVSDAAPRIKKLEVGSDAFETELIAQKAGENEPEEPEKQQDNKSGDLKKEETGQEFRSLLSECRFLIHGKTFLQKNLICLTMTTKKSR